MSRKDIPVILLLALVVAGFFPDAALFRRTFFYQDTAIQNYPCRHFFAGQWKQGRYPLWCPDMLGGFPLFAEGQSGAAYPLNLLLYPFLPTWAALNLSILLHLALAAVGMFFLLRLWANRWGAALGAMTYALNGWMLSHLIHINAVSAAAWTPWAFFCLERAFRNGRIGAMLLAGAALAMQFLAGHPQTALITALGMVLFVIVRAIIENGKDRVVSENEAGSAAGSISPALRIVLAGAGVLGFAVALAAIQILPAFELVQHSSRARGQSHEFLTFGSFPPSFVALFFLPHFYGSPANATDWLHGLDLPFHEMSFYVGLLPLFLAVVALLRRRDRPVLLFALLLFFSGLLMLGRYTPFYQLHELVLVFNRLRAPVRYAYLAVFALSALAGLGLDGLVRQSESWREQFKDTWTERHLVAALAAFSLLVPLLLGAWVYRHLPGNSSEIALRLKGELLADGVRSILFLTCAAVLLMKLRIGGGASRHCLGTVLLVTALDLWTANHGLNPVIDPAYYTTPPKTAQWLQQAPSDGGGRIYDFDRTRHPTPGGWNFRWPYFEEREPLNVCFPMSYGLSTLDGHVGLYLDRWWAYDHQISANRLGAMAVRYVVGEPPGDQRWFRKTSASTPLPIYENLKAAPRAFLVQRALTFSDPAAFFEEFESDTFDPKTTLLLEEGLPLDGEPHAGAPVTFRVDEPDRVVLEVEVKVASYLVLADAWYPGWEVFVDRRPAPVYRANFYARAVPVNRGTRRVEFRYRPASFRWGASITGAAIVLGLLAFFALRSRPFFQIGGKELSGRSVPGPAFSRLIIVAAFILLLSLTLEWGHWSKVFQQF